MSDKPESVVRAEVLAVVPGATAFKTETGHHIDDPAGDRYLAYQAPSRRAAWRRALKFLRESAR